MKYIKLFESFDATGLVYHGTTKDFATFKLGQNIANPTYGGDELDHGLGIFFTDNLTMAKFFAGLTSYDPDEDAYVDKPGPGRVLSAKLDIKKPWILNEQVPDAGDNSDDDPGQDYFRVIKEAGGGEKFKEKLMHEGYDAVIVRDAVTNYYEEGTYDIYVVFDPAQINIVSKSVK